MSETARARGLSRDIAATLLVVVGVPTIVLWFALSPGARVPERCASLFGRYLDLSLANGTTPRDRDELVANTKSSDIARHALDRCEDGLTERQAACADDARDVDAFERCFP